eukprot:TRINITY_DN80454_c0_g1_i1.p1 TRINITY_DN80454_c0_g1~~TRINITY_DN80454_c0_g1_i1.p1  ORF type:complete len:443 (-),score=109.78 TRINITY_DN80454_c0_g1_i1:72-1325(-)
MDLFIHWYNLDWQWRESLPSAYSIISTEKEVDLDAISSSHLAGLPWIGTHSGSFHADEALSTSILRLLPAYRNAVIIRTRNEKILGRCDIVVDVGQEYDVDKKRFDHHMKTFSATFDDTSKTKLSSAGLIFKHYGEEILKTLLQTVARSGDAFWSSASEESVSNASRVLGRKLYKKLIECIDAIDNGISIADEVRYSGVSTTLSSRVESLQKPWNAVQSLVSLCSDCDESLSPSDIIGGDYESAIMFRCAMEIALSDFLMHFIKIALSWFPARSIVEEAISGSLKRARDGAEFAEVDDRILILSSSVPWASHLADLEREKGLKDRFLYVLFPDKRSDEAKETKEAVSWRVRAVSVTPESFESRKALPMRWRGLRDGELDSVSGVSGCIFVHSSGFIGGNKSFEGALEMARQAVLAEE